MSKDQSAEEKFVKQLFSFRERMYYDFLGMIIQLTIQVALASCPYDTLSTFSRE